ncbi:hypothetical protein BJY24_003190 [Nocardia transvalensis]|uniref:Uncharacterized protein n=1 Tax=Nocardia transvalensis TaxID=37333 RepID=A0A7W9PEQ8_9NOCA|nr:hypothetical protein [Nocardia transvalensis]
MFPARFWPESSGDPGQKRAGKVWGARRDVWGACRNVWRPRGGKVGGACHEEGERVPGNAGVL